MFAALNSFLTRAVSGYFLNKSLRFRGSASAYLNRTPAVAGNRRTFTISYWIKRGTLGTSQYVFAAGSGTTESTWFATPFDTNGTSFDAAVASTWTTSLGATTALFRDPAAWYHFVWAVDTTQAVASDRSKIYVNGVLQTPLATAVAVTQNTDLAWNNSGVVHYIGARIDGGPRSFFDGEMAEINSVDGQALAPTAFGASSTYNQWLPIRYAGTYGTNGFYLPFTNTASTSTLVADSSGNANNWTPNNISLTAGSTYDSLTDVPTLTSTTVANYAVINPLTARGSATATNGNLTYTAAAANDSSIFMTMAVPSNNLIYFELFYSIDLGLGNNSYVGVSSVGDTGALITTGTNLWSYNLYNGVAYNQSSTTTYTTVTNGQTAQYAFDIANGKMWVGANGTWFNSGNPVAGTGAVLTSIPITATNLFASLNGGGSNRSKIDFNFGQRPFAYTPPTNFLALNTFNI